MRARERYVGRIWLEWLQGQPGPGLAIVGTMKEWETIHACIEYLSNRGYHVIVGPSGACYTLVLVPIPEKMPLGSPMVSVAYRGNELYALCRAGAEEVRLLSSHTRQHTVRVREVERWVAS